MEPTDLQKIEAVLKEVHLNYNKPAEVDGGEVLMIDELSHHWNGDPGTHLRIEFWPNGSLRAIGAFRE